MGGLNGLNDDEETNLLTLKQSSTRLLPGLELMPTIDPNSGRLLSEWMSEEELEMLYNEEMGKEDSDGEVEMGLSDVEEYWETSDNEKGCNSDTSTARIDFNNSVPISQVQGIDI
ncbi:hypothetical protein K435DRAFT_873419 [Dendrothele bispora CBS 962.96]|uniref:Uncharacterized protein n=1 Tax=Dendrothele bispora (strain CBS 962.96) TaxID=1314807 RepID=A0A4S8KZ71_DENBC|nr:hypothetical protein K435DRAFT_873419 [Dendrothele bispora CBS 962.96]